MYFATQLKNYAASRFPMRILDFSIDPNPSSRAVALGSIQLLTEMSTRNLSGDKGRRVIKAGNLTAVCEPTIYTTWGALCLTTLLASKAPYKVIDVQVNAFALVRNRGERSASLPGRLNPRGIVSGII
jgi:hypothetical protein